jgi:uridine kinase
LFDLKVFIDVDADTRLSRTVLRDIASRYTKQLDRVLHYYTKFVKPSFDDFVYPTKKYSDITIPRGEDNVVAIELLTEHIAELINKK